jgi:hypothetical protein
MKLISGLGKKHAFIALGAGAAVFAAVVLRDVPAGIPRAAEGARIDGAAPAVTLEGYRAEASGAVKGLRPGDLASAESALSALIALRVPKEGMAAHQALVISLAAYRDALKSGDGSLAAASLARIKEQGQAEPWLQLAM